MKVNRRNFLKTSGVFGVGVMAFNPFINAFGKADKSSKKDPTSSTWVATTCQGCTTWCPIECNVQDGRVVKVRGNVNSMINDGKVCPKGHFIPSQAYDPDRLKFPMKRTNPTKGAGVDPGFVPTTWADALNIIATKIMELRTADETDKYMLMRGRYTYSRDIIYKCTTQIIGSPNGVSHSSICAEAENAAADYTEGKWGYRDYDLNNTQFLLLWGVDPFRSNRGIPSALASLKTMQSNGAKIVTVDPSLTGGAAKSDQWLPIKPGEDGALAVAIAHQLLVSNKWSTTFVGDWFCCRYTCC
jgi:anaerobic selenocysteine-containing dehydrogenase